MSFNPLFIQWYCEEQQLDSNVKHSILVRSGLKQTEKGKAEEGKTEKGKTEKGKAEEGKTEEGKAEEGKTEEGKTEEIVPNPLFERDCFSVVETITLPNMSLE